MSENKVIQSKPIHDFEQRHLRRGDFLGEKTFRHISIHISASWIVGLGCSKWAGHLGSVKRAHRGRHMQNHVDLLGGKKVQWAARPAKAD